MNLKIKLTDGTEVNIASEHWTNFKNTKKHFRVCDKNYVMFETKKKNVLFVLQN